jgi:CheY-like chemotaxis protein
VIREAKPSKSVLVVEDDDLIRGAMRMVLEWEGYRVSCAEDGRQALDLLRTGERPACILLDLMMPVLDGWSFRKEQQQDPDLAAIPVVVVSAIEAKDSPQADGHVQKPFQPEELLAALGGVG